MNGHDPTVTVQGQMEHCRHDFTHAGNLVRAQDGNPGQPPHYQRDQPNPLIRRLQVCTPFPSLVLSLCLSHSVSLSFISPRNAGSANAKMKQSYYSADHVGLRKPSKSSARAKAIGIQDPAHCMNADRVSECERQDL
eukprot:m.148687 g.148687  ORF g.148687 m.148687 type:complete len:137 (+) comp23213_c0_seq1:386-796(+)